MITSNREPSERQQFKQTKVQDFALAGSQTPGCKEADTSLSAMVEETKSTPGALETKQTDETTYRESNTPAPSDLETPGGQI